MKKNCALNVVFLILDLGYFILLDLLTIKSYFYIIESKHFFIKNYIDSH